MDEFSNTAEIPGETGRPELVVITAKFTDQRAAETHTAVINWGDGSNPQQAVVVESGGSGTITAVHEFPTGGIFVVTLELKDAHQGTISRTTTAYVTGFRSLGRELQIVGSEGNDIITVVPLGATQFFVDMTLPGAGNFRLKFALADVERLRVYVGAGNDRVMISERLYFETYIDGGPHQDHLDGGDGPNTLLGGPGDDTILGGPDRDILIGGQGQNRLQGFGGEDVLVAGDWLDAESSWEEALAIWISDEPFATRQTMLAGVIAVSANPGVDYLFSGDHSDLCVVSLNDIVDGGTSPTQDSVVYFSEVTSHASSPLALAGGSVPRSGESESPLANASDAPEPMAVARDRLDANGDHQVTPQDIVTIINALNSGRSGQVTANSAHLDANGDGWVTALDVLAVVNQLNARGVAAEGEAAATGQVTADGIDAATEELHLLDLVIDEIALARQLRKPAKFDTGRMA